jgi:formylglycine-generating enzyme required for sulfatase activity
VDFETEIKPIIEAACVHCHNESRAEGGLRLDTFEAAVAEDEHAPAIVPGDPENSSFYALAVLAADDALVMPPEGPPLDESQARRIRAWIEEGAAWPKEAVLEVQPRIDFVEHVQPILEMNCLSCHSGETPEGDYNLTTHDGALQSGLSPPSIVPTKPDESSLYQLTAVDKDDPTLMPPADQGGPLAKDSIEILRLWIAQGAIWPDGVALKTRPRAPTNAPTPDDMQLVRRLHALITERAQQDGDAQSGDYTGTIPRTGVPYHMVELAGGEFLMGSPDGEPGRQETEGPQTTVEVSPFWIGKNEVTWDEYEPFMITQVDRYKNGARKDFDPAVHDDVDAVSGPTAPYVEMSFGMGQKGFPAISMTQHAANKYCQWLSAQTGHFYRLPTEAEWEYACRAGTATAYSFGDDPESLEEHAWFIDNSNEKYQLVGKKPPNPWGLYDMHGNVAEWTADQFTPDYFRNLKAGPSNPFVKPQALYPRSVRGGSWADDPELLRSAARRGSEAYWQQQDPQLPKSVWYLTDAPWLGFRIVRPKSIPSIEEMYFYWNSSTNKR